LYERMDENQGERLLIDLKKHYDCAFGYDRND
jgi:hypothetical protein